MENIIVATFDNEKSAIEGLHKLSELNEQGDIFTYNKVLIRRNSDGTFDYLKDASEGSEWKTMEGMPVGLGIGGIGGPVGALAKHFGGFTKADFADLAKYSFEYDFLESLKDGLPKGTTSLIAQVSEPNDLIINNAFQPLNVGIWRSNVYAQRDRYVQNQVDLLDAQIAEAEKEWSVAAADAKAKIQAGIADLKARRDAKVAEIKADFQEDIDEMNAKIDRFKQTLQGKVDETRRKVLEYRLAHNENKLKSYKAQAEKLNGEIEKYGQAAKA